MSTMTARLPYAEAQALSLPALRLMEPNLPSADELLPWLRQIDAARHYTNFGPLVQALEFRLAETLSWDDGGTPMLVSAASGTAALWLAVAALELAPGSRVLVPAFTFPATAAVIRQLGLEPVFLDVSADSWSLTPALARQALEHGEASLVMPVATFGCPQPVEAWDAFQRETGVPVVIDAAAAYGAQAAGRRATVCFSFHATKPFGIGEGGAVVTADPALAVRVRQLSNFGFQFGRVEALGGNAKLSEYHAAVGLAQLARWDKVRSAQRRVWSHYRRALLASELDIGLQAVPNGWIPSVLPVRLGGIDPAAVAAGLGRRGVPSRRWYTPALDRQPAFGGARCIGPGGGGELPVTRQLERSLVGLPFHGFLRPAQVRQVVAALTATLAETRPQPVGPA